MGVADAMLTLSVARFLFAVLALTVGCGKARTPIVLAVQPPSTNNYPTQFASWLGYFEEEGVAVNLSQIAGASKVLEAVVADSAEIGSGVYEQAIQMAAERKDVVCFVTLIKSPNFAIVAGANSAVKRIEDLRGKSVGVSSLGSPSQFYLNYLLGLRGIPPEDVSTAGIGMGASASVAVEKDQVAAAVLFGSAVTAQEARGARVLADARTPEGLKALLGVDDYPASCLLARRGWLKSHEEEARKIARATVRALAWVRQHSPEEVLAKVPAEFRVGDSKAELEAIRLAQPMYSLDGRIRAESAEAVRKVLAASVQSVRVADIDLKRTYTNEYLQ